MTMAVDFILGEHQRTLDERYRVSIPMEMCDALTHSIEGQECILTKERPGCLSLWNAALWQEKLNQGIQLIRDKMVAGHMNGRIDQLQTLGRLLSTRQKSVQFAGRGRLVLPEGFREFLGVEPGGEIVIVGAAICVELWKPERWLDYLDGRMPKFRRLFDQLAH
ncbi:MAG: division/cell wall cluster transcriptional repressor MraZ [Planctomycetia bacterium]|nr:division/cell wall cluster transcriptional repressor MraZ [Planctomycetia bacterium]